MYTGQEDEKSKKWWRVSERARQHFLTQVRTRWVSPVNWIRRGEETFCQMWSSHTMREYASSRERKEEEECKASRHRPMWPSKSPLLMYNTMVLFIESETKQQRRRRRRRDNCLAIIWWMWRRMNDCLFTLTRESKSPRKKKRNNTWVKWVKVKVDTRRHF